MNSGTSSTELNDMFTDFVNYVDSFYGQNDPLYPMMSQETKQPLQSMTFLEQQRTTYQCVVIRLTSLALGGMAILLTEKESETSYFMITTTSL